MAAAHRPADRAQSVVALGGGHGLHASLRALRRLVDDVVVDELTAVVTVADNGGSSGRLRGEFGVLPPGDLRMALAALCGVDEWGETWERVLQHRFAGEGEMNGHVVGNLLIVACGSSWGTTSRRWTRRTAAGRGGPGAADGVDPAGHHRPGARARPGRRGRPDPGAGPGRGRHDRGRDHPGRLEPAVPRPCPEALAAVAAADWVVLGPGSWFSSVIPHLLVPDLCRALVETSARVVVVLNLDEQPGETGGFGPADHLAVLVEHAPDLAVHTVLADARLEPADDEHLREVVEAAGARLVVADVAADDGSPRHDPVKLAAAYESIVLGTDPLG